MGDSDDDFNSSNQISNQNNSNLNNSNNGTYSNNLKKNRDKFYKERDDSTYSNNSNNNSYNHNNNKNDRRDWSNDRNRGNDSWKGRSGGNYGGNNGGGGRFGGMNNSNSGASDYPRKYTHQTSPSGVGNHNYDTSPPPHKRNRKDWESGADSSYGGGYHQGSYQKSGQQLPHQIGFNASEPEYPTQPPFLSFKLFLQQQDDNISDEEAIKKYNEYKIEFKKTQINNFFLEHKEEEWFKSRYHPDENYKRRNEQNQFVLNRLEVFMDLFNKGWLDDVSAEYDKSKELIRFLDAVVIKLEGGSDQDVKKLLDGVTDEPEVKEIKPESSPKHSPKTEETDLDKKENDSKEPSDANESTEPGETTETGSNKRKSAEDSGSESGAYSDSDGEEKPNEHKKKKSNTNGTNKSSLKQLNRTSSIFMRNLAPSVTKYDLENLCKGYEGFKRVALSDPAPERGFFRRGWITFESYVDVKKICWSLQNIKIKDCNPGAIVNRELTNRIRPISNLVSHHKSVVKNDIKIAMKIIQNMDKRWNLWQNDDNSNTNSEQVVKKEEEKQEIEKEAPRETDKEDESTKDESNSAAAKPEAENLEDTAFNKLPTNGPQYLPHEFFGTNPLLNNITDYLVDEIDAEEEELLGDGSTSKTGDKTVTGSFNIDIDSKYNKVLDKLILYLRVVHSIDFYNCLEYQQEDLMPNRCGIMFVRPGLPLNAAAASLKINQDEINSYTAQFENKMKPYAEYKDKIDAEMAKKLGIKDRVEEIEKFIKTNTQELAPDRWLCPLSGKRFKGPEFIRKHLFYKHMDKINDVKKEVDYFNNYVFDPKRPQLPEHPSNKPGGGSQTGGSQQAAGSSGSHHQQQQQQQSGHHNQQTHQQQFQQQSHPSYSVSNSNPYQNSPALLVSPMMNPFSGIPNRTMNPGWQSGGPGYIPDMMQGGAGYGANFSPSFGPGGLPGNNYSYKKPGYGGSGPGPYANRRGKDSREMIQYRDLDAPDDN